jgi:PAS domain S-box-containing protein
MKIKSGKVASIKRSVFYSLIVVVAFSLLFNGLVWYITESNDLKQTTNALKEREINYEKEFIKQEVNKAISDIKFMAQYWKGIPIDTLKSEILEWIAKKRLKYGGYLFVNTTDGQALVYDGKRLPEYKSIKEMEDPSGLRLFDIELEAFVSPDGKFMEYLFKPINSDTPEEKLSYVKGLPEWKWIIGAGIYKKIPNQEIEKEKANYIKSFNNKIFLIILVAFILVTIAYFNVKIIGNRLAKQVNILTDSLKKIPENNEPIDLETIHFREFRSIEASVNQMTARKKELEETIAEKDESLKLVFKAAENVAFIITDLGGKDSLIKEFSQGAEAIFRYKKEEITGKELSILFKPESFAKFGRIQGLLGNGLKGFSGEAAMVNKSGKQISVFYTIHPLIKNNKAAGSILVVIDISKSKKTEEELRKLKVTLEQKVEERTSEIIRKNHELEGKNAELENYNNLFIGREFRINELKQKIKLLEAKLNGGGNDAE